MKTTTFLLRLGALALALCLMTVLLPARAEAAEPFGGSTFTFSDSGIAVSDGTGSGYKLEGTALTISESGVYTVTGSCAEGSITVKKGTTGVTLVLRDLTLASSDTAPLSCNKTTETTLYIAGDVTLRDLEDPANEDSADATLADAFEGAAVKVKSGASLTITGDGTLTADGSACKNGIKGAATASITVEDGVTLNISAANNGLASDGSLLVEGGTLNITAQGDAVKSEPDEDDAESAGTITVRGGSFTIDAAGDAFQAAGDLSITGGSFDVTTFGGCGNASALGDDSAKGLKSDTRVLVSGGDFTLNCADDAVHSDGSVELPGGVFHIRTGDDGVHANFDTILGTQGGAGPELTVETCYEGLEGARVLLNAGAGAIAASDDGINAATDETVSEIAIYIHGGSWHVNAGGDGLDAGGDSRNNTGGDVCVTGGVTEVFGAANGGNAGLDFDGACACTGGTLLVVDYSGMNQTPTSGTYVFFGQGGMGGMGGMGGPGMGWRSQEDGTVENAQMAAPGGQYGSGVSIVRGSAIEIRDASGNMVYSATGVKNANCVMLCGEPLRAGATYSLYVDGAQAATAAASEGSGQSGQQPGGTQPGQQPGGTQPGQQPGGTQPAEPGKSGFFDVSDGSWYSDAVAFVREQGYMKGTSGTTFDPEGTLTRAQIAQILMNFAGGSAEADASFTDVPDSAWYAPAVAWAREQGYVTGYGDGTFGPGDEITRAQLVTVPYRFAEKQGLDVSLRGDLSGYRDSAGVPGYASDAMAWAVETGLIQGTSETTLSPSGTATRAQMAKILQNFCEKLL